MKMKARELMIGDWVYNSYHKKNIQWNYGEMFCPNGNPVIGKDLYPIPLTAEILEKNRWKEMPNGTICLYDKFDNSKSIICDKGLVFTFLDRTFKLIYVHEFQHALRLCGLNGLADNFKI